MLFLIILPIMSVFSSGNLELVNTQEMELNNIDDIRISYSSEKVILLMGTTDKLIINEYMNENNEKFFAHITKTGNTLIVESGRRPFRPVFNFFNRRLEVYLPRSYGNAININTKSGNIESSADLLCSKINIESSSGRIRLNSISADTVSVKNSSGNINIDSIRGNVSVKSSSGDVDIGNINGEASIESNSSRIVIDKFTGILTAKSSSGRIQCTVAEARGDITLTTSSGNINCSIIETEGDISLSSSSGTVRLNVPQNLSFNFSSRTSSGGLSTPFSDKLFSPVTDRNLTQGVIGANGNSEDIPTVKIRTSSGSIKVDWV